MSNMREQKQEETDANLITALQTGPGSRELSDRVLLKLGYSLRGLRLEPGQWVPLAPSPERNDAAIEWQTPDGLSIPTAARPHPTKEEKDMVALWPYGFDISVFEQPDHTWSASVDLDTAGDISGQIDDLETQKEARHAVARAGCLAILKAKEAE